MVRASGKDKSFRYAPEFKLKVIRTALERKLTGKEVKNLYNISRDLRTSNWPLQGDRNTLPWPCPWGNPLPEGRRGERKVDPTSPSSAGSPAHEDLGQESTLGPGISLGPYASSGPLSSG